jgi:hypothetical protein
MSREFKSSRQNDKSMTKSQPQVHPSVISIGYTTKQACPIRGIACNNAVFFHFHTSSHPHTKAKGVFLMAALRIITWISRITGVGALLLGLTFWITGLTSIPGIHMLFGIVFTLSFLILSIMVLFASGTRLLGGVGIVYALILPVFGIIQASLLVGDLHWLIRVAHMLVGIGAMLVIQTIYTRYEHLKQPARQTATVG